MGKNKQPLSFDDYMAYPQLIPKLKPHEQFIEDKLREQAIRFHRAFDEQALEHMKREMALQNKITELQIIIQSQQKEIEELENAK